MMAQQQEAMRRVQEMRDRARRTAGLEESENEATDVPAPTKITREKQENETTLITLLLLILMAEDASPELTFALLYLLT